MKLKALVTILVICCFVIIGKADVSHETIVAYKFAGTLGKVMSVFGVGKPIHNIEYYKGDIKKIDTLDKKGKVRSSEIIDLVNELFISIDHKKKRYTQKTFEEWRKKMQAAMGEMGEVEEEEYSADDEKSESEREYSYEIDIQTSEEPEEINGFQSKKMTVTVELYSKKRGSEEEPVKEMIITSDNWLSDDISGNDEIIAFNQKLMEKLGFNPVAGKMADMFKQLSESNPQLASAMQKMESEDKKLDGIPVRTITVFTSTKPKEEEQEEEKSSGGLFGGLKKKAAKKILGDGSGPKEVLDIKSNILSHSTDNLDADSFKVPVKYKLKK